MATDIASGQPAEIGEINGYLVSLASRLGVPSPLNKQVSDMVKFIGALSGNYTSASVPAQYRIPLKGTQNALKSDAEISMQERKIALEERKMDLEERMIRVKEDEALDRVQARRRRRRDGEADKRAAAKGWYDALVQRQNERGQARSEERAGEGDVRGRERVERRRRIQEAARLRREKAGVDGQGMKEGEGPVGEGRIQRQASA